MNNNGNGFHKTATAPTANVGVLIMPEVMTQDEVKKLDESLAKGLRTERRINPPRRFLDINFHELVEKGRKYGVMVIGGLTIGFGLPISLEILFPGLFRYQVVTSLGRWNFSSDLIGAVQIFTISFVCTVMQFSFKTMSKRFGEMTAAFVTSASMSIYASLMFLMWGLNNGHDSWGVLIIGVVVGYFVATRPPLPKRI